MAKKKTKAGSYYAELTADTAVLQRLPRAARVYALGHIDDILGVLTRTGLRIEGERTAASRELQAAACAYAAECAKAKASLRRAAKGRRSRG